MLAKLSRESGWREIGRSRYLLLASVVVSQLITVLVTWPLWQTREVPVHLPAISVGQIPFGGLMVVSMLLVVWLPRPGVAVHCAVLVLACLFDQFRSQPQFAANCVLMLASISDSGRHWIRWLLAALWLWTGLHKFVSPEWWGHSSFWLLSRSGINPVNLHIPFVISVAFAECALGLMAMFRPRWAAYACPALHILIAISLTPLGFNWNYSVIPWNLAMAIVGSWIMWQAAEEKERTIGTWERRFAVVCLIWPAGFYMSWIDHGFAHVLYSDWLPRAVVSQADGSYEVYGWRDLHVPFPKERRLHRLYFREAGQPGDKLHIADSRPWLDDQYFVMTADRTVVAISVESFYDSSPGSVDGVGVESNQSIFMLARSGADMKRREDGGPIYAIVFDPQYFDRRCMKYLPRLPNLEQIQLRGTSVQDEDLRHLESLPYLKGLGLNDTAITDDGIKRLRKCRRLNVVECYGTEITDDVLKQQGLRKGGR